MARYKIKARQFCSLSKEIKWQNWLKSVAPDLNRDLLSHLTKSKSCRSNSEKMSVIQKELATRGKSMDMVNFLKKEFPIVIEEENDKPQAITIKRSSNPGRLVFAYYNPELLTFPHKLIMENTDQQQLTRDVKDFCSKHFGTDYVIIENMAYIEYFPLKYESEVSKIDYTTREIVLFRKRFKISSGEKIISKEKLR